MSNYYETKRMLANTIAKELQTLVYGQVKMEENYIVDSYRLGIFQGDFHYVVDLSERLDRAVAEQYSNVYIEPALIVKDILEDYKCMILGKYIV